MFDLIPFDYGRNGLMTDYKKTIGKYFDDDFFNFGNFIGRPVKSLWNVSKNGEWSPRDVSISRDDHRIFYQLDVPGTPKEDIEISLIDRELHVDWIRNGQKNHMLWTVAEDVDLESNPIAHLENGVLRIEFERIEREKSDKKKGKTIRIE